MSEVAPPCTRPLFCDAAGLFVPRSFGAVRRAARFRERSQAAEVAESALRDPFLTFNTFPHSDRATLLSDTVLQAQLRQAEL